MLDDNGVVWTDSSLKFVVGVLIAFFCLNHSDSFLKKLKVNTAFQVAKATTEPHG